MISPISEFLLIDVEYESRTTFELFEQLIIQQNIPRLYLLDCNRLSEIPDLKNPPKLSTLDEKFKFIRDFMDVLGAKDQTIDPKAKKPTSKNAVVFEDGTLKTTKTVILLANFNFCQTIKDEFNQKAVEIQQQYTDTLLQFITNMNTNGSADESFNFDDLKYPELQDQVPVYQQFTDLQIKHNICISSYIQISEDYPLQELLKTDMDFSDFLTKNNLLPAKPTYFTEQELYQFTFNPYQELNTKLPPPKVLFTKVNPDEKKKKVQKIVRDPLVAPLCNNDGSVNYQKMFQYIKDNKYININTYDTDVKLIPFFDLHNFSKFQNYFNLFKLLKTQTFKDDKAAAVWLKDKMNDQQYIISQLNQFLAQLNNLLTAPIEYKQFIEQSQFVNTQEFDQNYYLGKQQEFRVNQYYNILTQNVTEGMRVVESSVVAKNAPKPQKGQTVEEKVYVQLTNRFLNDKLNYLHKFANDDKDYLLSIKKIDVVKQLQAHKPDLQLDHYYAQLNKLQYVDQNRIGCIMESMLCQLEQTEQSNNQITKSQTASRAGSAKKKQEPIKKPASQANNRVDDKKKKNTGDETAVPYNPAVILQIPPKDLNIFQNLIQYETPQQIDVDLINIAAKFGFQLNKNEQTVQFTEKGIEKQETEDKQNKLLKTEIDLFLNQAEQHEQHALKYLVLKSKQIFEDRSNYNSIQQEEAIKVNEKLMREDFIKQYDQYIIKQQEFEKQQKMNKLKNKKKDDIVKEEIFPSFEYQKQYLDFQPLLQELSQNFEFNKNQFASFQYQLNNDKIGVNISSSLFDLVNFQSNYNDFQKQMFQLSQNNSQFQLSELYKRFQNNIFDMYQVVPHFTQFVNNPLINKYLKYDKQEFDIQLKLVKTHERYHIPRQKLSDNFQYYEAPLFCCEKDKIKLTECLQPVLVNSDCNNVFQLFTMKYGSVAVKFNDPPIQDQTIDKYNELQKILNKKDEPVIEAPPPQKVEEVQAPPSQRGTKQPLSSRKNERSGSASKKVAQEPVVLLPPAPKKPAPLQPLSTFNFFFELFHTPAKLNFEQATKTPIDIEGGNVEFDIDVPSLAPDYDVQSANLHCQYYQQINKLGVNMIQHDVCGNQVKQTIMANQLGPVKVVFNGFEQQQYIISDIDGSLINKPKKPDNLVEQYEQYNQFQKCTFQFNANKKSRENESQQVQEIRKRKKRLQEFQAVCNQEINRRNNILQLINKKQILGQRPEKSNLRISVPFDDISIYANQISKELVINYTSVQVRLGFDKNITLTKYYNNVDLTQLVDKQFQYIIQLLCDKLGEGKKKDYYSVDIVYQFNPQQVKLSCFLQHEINQEQAEVQLLDIDTKLTEKYNKFVEDIQPVPNSGARIYETLDELYATSIHYQLQSFDNQKLFNVDSETLLPQVTQDSRVMKWFYQNQLCGLGEFSQLLKKQNIEQLINTKNDYKKDWFFENVIQNVHDPSRNALRDSSQFQKEVRRVIQTFDKQCYLTLLQCGIAAFYDENDKLTCLYNDGETTDFFEITKDQLLYRHFDQIDVKYNTENVVELSESFAESSIYKYDLTKTQMFLDQNLSINLGVPQQNAHVRESDYFAHLPDIYNVMLKGEILPKSQYHFLECFKPKYADSFLQQQVKLFYQIQKQVFSLVYVGPSSLLTQTVCNNELFLQQKLIMDFNYTIHAQNQSMPTYTPMEFFQMIQIRRQEIESNVAQIGELYAEQTEATNAPQENSVSSVYNTGSKKALSAFASEIHLIKNDYKKDNQMQLQFYDRNTYGSYWDTPEGKLYQVQNQDSYNKLIDGYKQLSEQVLEKEKIYKPHKNLTQNTIITAKLQQSIKNLPQVLQKPDFVVPQSERIVKNDEKRQLEVTYIKSEQYSVVEQMRFTAIREQEALACKNDEYLQFEGNNLKQTKTCKMTGQKYRRFLHTQPKQILMRLTIQQLEQIYEEQLDEKNQKRIKLGLKEAAKEDKRIVKLFHPFKVKNFGTESLHVRLMREQDDFVKYLVFPSAKNGGIPSGIQMDALVEIHIDLNIKENIFSQIIMKTEEEIICLPLTIIIFEDQLSQNVDNQQEGQEPELEEHFSGDDEEYQNVDYENVDEVDQADAPDVDRSIANQMQEEQKEVQQQRSSMEEDMDFVEQEQIDEAGEEFEDKSV